MTFASTARLQLPLSYDEAVWQAILDTLSPVSYGSVTDIDTALASALLTYGTTPLHIVLITDGETTTDIATQTGVVLPGSMDLTLIGIGTPSGGRIVMGVSSTRSMKARKSSHVWMPSISRDSRICMMQTSWG